MPLLLPQAFIKAFQLNGYLLAPLCSSKAKQRLVVMKTLAKMTKLSKKVGSTSRPNSAGSRKSTGTSSPFPDADKKARPSSVSGKACFNAEPQAANAPHDDVCSRAECPLEL